MSATRRASCHCGAVKLELTLEQGLEPLLRCNCSLCKRKGTIMLSLPQDRVRVLEGAELLSLYQWNTGVAEHYFCSVCGIYTHHRRRRDPTQFGINVACIDGVNTFDLGEVATVDGASLSLVQEAD